MTIQERKDDLLSLAKNALDFQMEAPNTSLSLMRWMQYLAPYYAFLYLLCRQEKVVRRYDSINRVQIDSDFIILYRNQVVEKVTI